jgi:hypothetical protein
LRVGWPVRSSVVVDSAIGSSSGTSCVTTAVGP